MPITLVSGDNVFFFAQTLLAYIHPQCKQFTLLLCIANCLDLERESKICLNAFVNVLVIKKIIK